MTAFLKKNVRYLILGAAAASCLYGIAGGEMQTVLYKAVQICLECCGIG